MPGGVPTMATYDAYEQTMQAEIDKMRKRSIECINCPTCGSQWFEEKKVNRYQQNHHVILGQDVPPEPNTVPYILLKCVHCNNWLEPRVLHSTRDIAGDRYDSLLDTLEGKNDIRKQEKQPEEENKDGEIPSEGL